MGMSESIPGEEEAVSSRAGHSGRTPWSLSHPFCWEKTDPRWKRAAPTMRKGLGGPRKWGAQGAAPLDAEGTPAPRGRDPKAGQSVGRGQNPQTEPTDSPLSPDRAADLVHSASNTLIRDQNSRSL